MICGVKYCDGEQTPTLGLCKSHVKAWHKDGEPVGEALDAWLKNQSDLKLDVCPTPIELAYEICRQLQNLEQETTLGEPFRILEPSAGDGPFVKAARAVWPDAEITAVEIRPEMMAPLGAAGADQVVIGSIDHPSVIEAMHVSDADLIPGNPPFGQAEEHIRELLANMKDGAHLAFLLRVGFYESFERLPFWREHPEKFFAPIVPRPGFKLNGQGKMGTDSQAYMVCIWQKGWTGPSMRLPHLVWAAPKKRGGRRKKTEEMKVEAKQANAPELDVDGVEAPELE